MDLLYLGESEKSSFHWGWGGVNPLAGDAVILQGVCECCSFSGNQAAAPYFVAPNDVWFLLLPSFGTIQLLTLTET